MSWLTVSQAAKLLQLSRRAVYDAVHGSKIKSKQVHGLIVVDVTTYKGRKAQTERTEA